MVLSTNISFASSFLQGMSRALDLGATFDRGNVAQQSDSESIREDWESVGNALYEAMGQYGQSTN